MAVGEYVFSGFLTPVLTQLFFPKPPTTFLTRFCKGERQKYAGKKSRLNRASNTQPPGHESDTLTTEPPRQGKCMTDILENTSVNMHDLHISTVLRKIEFNLLPNNKILDMTKLKAFAETT